MLIEFRERFELPVGQVFAYFRSPRDWARLYGLAGTVRDLGDGWIAVPLKSFPFPLVAKNTEVRPDAYVRWVFRGFWAGTGEVRFTGSDGATLVEGYERIGIRWLGPLSRPVEKLFLEQQFRAIWALGWRRLRRSAGSARPVARQHD
ncbi:MAG: hypothetical protein FJ191_03015 [Gammaproteobacteria bacterium]|nr:hypothetical protein [Gammaproteobacteria bacterium]